MLGRRTLARAAVASQPKSLSRSPRFRLLRLQNTNGRKTTNVSPPTTRIARYLIYAVTDSVFRRDVFGGVIGEYFVFSAVDTTKSKNVPSGLSGLHRKTPDGGGLRRPCLHYTLTHESGKRMLLRLNEFWTLDRTDSRSTRLLRPRSFVLANLSRRFEDPQCPHGPVVVFRRVPRGSVLLQKVEELPKNFRNTR